MPLYVYLCQDCGEQFEKMMRFSELEQAPECPICHGQHTHKQITTFASTFSGSGGTSGSSSSGCGSSGRFT